MIVVLCPVFGGEQTERVGRNFIKSKLLFANYVIEARIN